MGLGYDIGDWGPPPGNGPFLYDMYSVRVVRITYFSGLRTLKSGIGQVFFWGVGVGVSFTLAKSTFLPHPQVQRSPMKLNRNRLDSVVCSPRAIK